MKYTVKIDNVSNVQWEKCASKFTDHSIYQTYAYQKIRVRNGRQEFKSIIIEDDNGEVVLMCHVRIKAIKPLGIRLGYVQSGPLMLREHYDLGRLPDLLKQFRSSCLDAGINIIRIMPNLRGDEIGGNIGNILESNGFLKNSGVSPYHTIIVSLEPTEDEILSKLHRDNKRILRKVEKLQIDVREGTSREYFSILENLYAGAKDRKGFKGLDSAEFAETQQILEEDKKAIVLIAYYEGQPVTAHATTHFGNTAVPILTANKEAGLRCGTSQLLWWKAYLIAKKLGMRYYDLGGIDPNKNPKGYFFKNRMGGEEAFHIGTFETYANPLVKSIWLPVEYAYRFITGKNR
jgi:lipid II:glycine glycyltransferase (peptidoglycan interpeptide bridge formation enzyme)